MLITPTIRYEDSYHEYIKELGSETRYPYPLDLDHRDFPRLVEKLNGYAHGVNLPDHLVPNTTFWLVEGDDIVGCSHLRHRLNDALRTAGGHIGLGIRPSRRGLGYGTQLLNLTLEKATLMGITEVHIHCYESNKVCASLILSVGAKLASTLNVEDQNNENHQSEKILRFIYSPRVPHHNV